MLVLSKLEWEVNLVIALDYLEPLNSLLTMPKAVTNESKNLICTLSSRYTTFRAIYSARTVALAALNVSQKNILSLFQQLDETLLSQCKTHFQMHKTPPNSQQLSPFKVESSSTPKSSRTPLKDSHNLIKQNTRRRLTSLNTTNEDIMKENNDSAIGLLSTSAESPPSSKVSSQHSSPDSGASSGTSPPLHKLLESTHISD